jgi:hypothetical protein
MQRRAPGRGFSQSTAWGLVLATVAATALLEELLLGNGGGDGQLGGSCPTASQRLGHPQGRVPFTKGEAPRASLHASLRLPLLVAQGPARSRNLPCRCQHFGRSDRIMAVGACRPPPPPHTHTRTTRGRPESGTGALALLRGSLSSQPQDAAEQLVRELVSLRSTDLEWDPPGCTPPSVNLSNLDKHNCRLVSDVCIDQVGAKFEDLNTWKCTSTR